MLKTMFIGKNRQHPLQPFVGELDYPAAALADEVFMVTLSDGRLISLESFAEFMSADQPAFQQKVERAIDGGHTHPFALALQLAAYALHRKVILGEKDDLGNEIPLAGERLMMFPEIAMEALEKSCSLSLVQSCH
jgi:hypothetical protein